MDLALKHSVVLLRPNYRKLPESTGLQILEGLAEFWKWFRGGGLQAAVVVGSATKEGEVEVDGRRTLLVGHSAGTFILPPHPNLFFSRCLFFLFFFPLSPMVVACFNGHFRTCLPCRKTI